MLSLSVRALARSSGVSHSQILRIESGEFDCLTSSFVRLCGAMGLPFSDLLECCILVDYGVYEGAVKAELAEHFKDDAESKMALIDLLLGASITISHLLRASDPVSAAGEFWYPSDKIAERLRQIAGQLADRPMDISQRFIFLNQLQQKPAATLSRFFGFPTQEELAAHVMLSRSKERALLFPWMPERRSPSIARWNFDVSRQFYDNQKQLTNTATCSSFTGDVKKQWPALKQKLQQATAEAGAKSRLAKFLDVDLTRISQWLTASKRAREPGAEYALRMLYWVSHPELQK
jgi:transcriptional regulator with XRE-family HTH domain